MSITIFCRSGGSLSSHTLLTMAIDTSMVSLVTVMTLTTSLNLKATKIEVPLMVPSMTPRCSEGSTSLERHRHRGGAEPAHLLALHGGGVDAQFLAGEIGERMIGFLAA